MGKEYNRSIKNASKSRLEDSIFDNRISEKREELLKKELWTVSDVAAYLGRSKGTIYNKISKNEIPSRKRGGRYFIPSEILSWIDEGVFK